MDLSAFSHGQIHSKLWLCETLEPYLKDDDNIGILGSWYNVLGFMLNVRKPNFYKNIIGYDKDTVQDVANKIIESWNHLPNQTVTNVNVDVNEINLTNHNVIINTSVEHMESTKWFNNIKQETLVCIQSLNLSADIAPYGIVNENKTLEELRNKFHLRKTVYTGTKEFDYPVLPYKRFMIIGYK